MHNGISGNKSTGSTSNKRSYDETLSPLEKFRQTETFKQMHESHKNKMIEEGLGRFITDKNDESRPDKK